MKLRDALTLAGLALVGLIVYGVYTVDTSTLRDWAIELGMDPTHAGASDRGELVRFIGQELLQGLALLAGVSFAARGLFLWARVGAAAAAGPLGWAASALLMAATTRVGGVVDDMAGAGLSALTGTGAGGDGAGEGGGVRLGLEYEPWTAPVDGAGWVPMLY